VGQRIAWRVSQRLPPTQSCWLLCQYSWPPTATSPAWERAEATTTAEQLVQLQETAEYLIARAVWGESVAPPAFWTAEQVAAFEAVLAGPLERAKLGPCH
jgi:hypothetical protein